MIKSLITELTKRDEVRAKIGHIYNFKIWMSDFKVESIGEKSISEMMGLLQVAKEKEKIALIDLMRLLMKYLPSAKEMLKHWNIIQTHIIQDLCCSVSPVNTEDKVLQNTHLISLKMLANIYLTESGSNFMHSSQNAENDIIALFKTSASSSNIKVQLTAITLLKNHMLSSQNPLPAVESEMLFECTLHQLSVITDPALVSSLLDIQIRLLYKNPEFLIAMKSQTRDKISKV